MRLRLTYNSTAVESKLKRFAAAGSTSTRHDWAFHVKPFGARNTARHSGGSATGASPQNMSRAKPALPDDSGTPFRKASDVSVRDTIMAQEGKELCVADLSGIELRTCMWWCEDYTAMAILSDPTRDLYTEDGRVYFNKPDMTKKDKDLRQASKVCALSAQYLVGWRKILHQAKLWGIPMTAETAQQLHKMYRVRHPAVVERWAELEKYMRDLVQGFKFEFPLYPCNMTHRGIEMPNGFLLRYPHIQYDYRERRFSYWNASKRCRVNLHAGMVVENCLAGDTEVLTERGWVRITEVTTSDRVWNGTRWCKHKGLTHRGSQRTINNNGVRMTSDHKVLTASGWCEAWKVGDKGVSYAERKVFKG